VRCAIEINADALHAASCHLLIGVNEAEQGKKKKPVRNDRLIAVAKEATDYSNLQTHRDLNDQLLKEYEHFFVSYHALTGKEYRILDVRGPKRAMRLVIQAQGMHRKRPLR
jgi:inorganic pyrophosphatase